MKNEKIITTIERYINTLNESEKASAFELSAIVQELKQELKEKALKETHGNGYLKRSKLVSKLLSKCFREDMQKAFNEKINGEDVTFYQDEKWNSLDVFENENGIAILCPVKPATK